MPPPTKDSKHIPNTFGNADPRAATERNNLFPMLAVTGGAIRAEFWPKRDRRVGLFQAGVQSVEGGFRPGSDPFNRQLNDGGHIFAKIANQAVRTVGTHGAERLREWCLCRRCDRLMFMAPAAGGPEAGTQA